jgi:hypothetical protein
MLPIPHGARLRLVEEALSSTYLTTEGLSHTCFTCLKTAKPRKTNQTSNIFVLHYCITAHVAIGFSV